MEMNKSSWTAEITATIRAVESLRKGSERILKDIYAYRFLHPAIRLLLKNSSIARFALWFVIDRRFPGAVDTLISRVRFVDDCLKKSIDDGIEQLVILGAGYDSRAYRFDGLKDKSVFEVDHPRTQAVKQGKLTEIFGRIPAHVTLVPVDFEKGNLMSKLNQAGYRKDFKTLFIWEAVCKYLTADAVDQLLTAVSTNASTGSRIVFDYLFESWINGSSGSEIANNMLDYHLRKGEPFIFGLPENNAEEVILSKGFNNVENISGTKIKKLYFESVERGRAFHPFWGIMQATV